MSKNTENRRPSPGTPEFEEWLKERASQRKKIMFGEGIRPNNFENGGLLNGDIDDLERTDAELFPEELEEYTSEERRKLIKIHKNNK